MLERPVAFLVLAAALFGAPGPPAKRPLNLDDLARLHDVAAPELSPDGHWVAYTVSSVDSKADKRVTHVWMANWEGSEELQLTKGRNRRVLHAGVRTGNIYRSFPRAGETKGSRYGC